MYSSTRLSTIAGLSYLAFLMVSAQQCPQTDILLVPGGSAAQLVSPITGSSCSAALINPNFPAVSFGNFTPAACGNNITIQEVSIANNIPPGPAILTIACQEECAILSSSIEVVVDSVLQSRFRRQVSGSTSIQFVCGSTSEENVGGGSSDSLNINTEASAMSIASTQESNMATTQVLNMTSASSPVTGTLSLGSLTPSATASTMTSQFVSPVLSNSQPGTTSSVSHSMNIA